MEGVAPPEALMEGVGGEDVPGLQEPKLDKYGVARCGHCRTCLKPHLKKACLTNKKKRKLQGFEPQTNFTKVKGEKRLKPKERVPPRRSSSCCCSCSCPTLQ